MKSTFLSVLLISGIYQPVDPSLPDICPQKVQVFYNDEGDLSALKVTYVGACFHWGPFEYPCEDEFFCSDGNGIEFRVLTNKSYEWYNAQYEVQSLFKLE